MLVERDHLLARLDDLRRTVVAGKGSIVFVTGDDEAPPGTPLRSVVGDLATYNHAIRLEVPPSHRTGSPCWRPTTARTRCRSPS
jgi:hypothetical protein